MPQCTAGLGSCTPLGAPGASIDARPSCWHGHPGAGWRFLKVITSEPGSGCGLGVSDGVGPSLRGVGPAAAASTEAGAGPWSPASATRPGCSCSEAALRAAPGLALSHPSCGSSGGHLYPAIARRCLLFPPICSVRRSPAFRGVLSLKGSALFHFGLRQARNQSTVQSCSIVKPSRIRSMASPSSAQNTGSRSTFCKHARAHTHTIGMKEDERSKEGADGPRASDER